MDRRILNGGDKRLPSGNCRLRGVIDIASPALTVMLGDAACSVP